MAPKKKLNTKSVKIIPLGGFDQIGRNMTIMEYGEDIIIIDCGQEFPGDNMPGIDCIICNYDYLREHYDKIRGVVLTHGHEDHIGGLPYFLKEFDVPVFGTRLTLALVESKLQEFNLKNAQLVAVTAGQSITLGEFEVEFIRTNHSIGEAVALAITTPAGVIIHTGDFKIDYTPIHGEPINLSRFAELGKKGVLALMSDSTNAERVGYTMSEKTVGEMFTQKFPQAKGRLLIATFASNVDRIQQVLNTAELVGRKVFAVGRSMVKVLEMAMELGYLDVPEGLIHDISEINDYKDEEICLLTTGSQGEPLSALARIASEDHKLVSIKPGDTIIFSSKTIPGNEKLVNNVINALLSKGASVSHENAHVSGHASQEELKLVYNLVKPEYFVPVHGEYRHTKAHANLIKAMGHPADKVIVMTNGSQLELSEAEAKIADQILDTTGVLVDGLGVGDVGTTVLRDRRTLSENGILIVSISVDHLSGKTVAGPDIISRGFVYVKESDELLNGCKAIVRMVLDKYPNLAIMDWGNLKNEIKDTLRAYLWNEIKRNPMILPIIMEIKD